VEEDVDLDKVISLEYDRKVSNGNTVSHKNKQYVPIIAGKKIELKEGLDVKVVQTLSNQVLIKYAGNYYDTEIVADYHSTAHTPAENHPWRTGVFSNVT
jgi:FKBP-type peptidyl-prolyl cis-trans isomerase 2